MCCFDFRIYKSPIFSVSIFIADHYVYKMHSFMEENIKRMDLLFFLLSWNDTLSVNCAHSRLNDKHARK